MSTHPQQRFASPSRSLSLLLHATGLASFLASFKHLSQYDMPIANAYGGYSQFLTILSLAVSTVTFAVAVVADLTLNSTLFSIKNKLAVVTAPVEVLVALMYWGIFAYDPQLLFPDEFRMPIIADIGFHAMPGIVLSLDVLFFSPPWTISASSMLALSNVLAFLYWAWVEQCYTHNGWYAAFLVRRIS
ncbi:integral membrane protein [Zalerion maritima]|uniref:Integral membrane protein n=1 Tax=Zalerion maritima TaxID=339359 RepID=A0AAD5RGJ4_9PEZI|nr:integral membrane protein [Zalerion maritima]